MKITDLPLVTQETTVQRLITDVRRHAQRVAELEGQLARTQEWLERFQGTATEQELELHELRPRARELRRLLLEVSLYVVNLPDELRRQVLPHISAGGATGDHGGVSKLVSEAGSNPAGPGRAGSNPAAPTGAVQVSPCPLCGSARTMSGNVASCLACGGTTRPVASDNPNVVCRGCHGAIPAVDHCQRCDGTGWENPGALRVKGHWNVRGRCAMCWQPWPCSIVLVVGGWPCPTHNVPYERRGNSVYCPKCA